MSVHMSNKQILMFSAPGGGGGEVNFCVKVWYFYTKNHCHKKHPNILIWEQTTATTFSSKLT